MFSVQFYIYKLTFGQDNDFFVVLRIEGHLAAPMASTYEMPVVPSPVITLSKLFLRVAK